MRSGYAWVLFLLFVGPFSGYAQISISSLPESKLAPVLQKTITPSTEQQYRIQVTNTLEFAYWLKQELPGITIHNQTASTHNLLLTGVTASGLNKLLQSPLVKYIDAPNRIPREELILEHADLTANNVTALHNQYPQLMGAGLVASIKENPFDTTDLDLKNRIVRTSALSHPSTTHATTMATLLAGGANSGPAGQGVAPRTRLASSSFSNLMPDPISDLLAMGVSVQNHSYGVTPENYYGLEAQAYDQQTQENKQLLHVFSAGNAGAEAIKTGVYANMPGWANLTGQFKLSKNTLSVGATDTSGQLNPITSRGPAYDGRIKPELVAFGEGGSSESAALVSGMALLVQQAYQEQTGVLPPAALVKAALINRARRLGNTEVSFTSGFGQADALGAIKAIREKQFFNREVKANNVVSVSIPVPEKTNFLKITLVWHDLEGNPDAAKVLINDLDLTVIQKNTNQRWLPWTLNTFPHPDSLALPARRSADHLNNVEHITIAKPSSGSYEVQVKGYQVIQGPQAFSLVYEVQPEGFSWNYPHKNSWLTAKDRNRIRWENQNNATTGKLEYRFLPHGNWLPVKEAVDLTKAFLDWHTPDTTALAQLRLTTNNFTAVSDTFGLFRSLVLRSGYNCGEEALLFWPKQAGINEYQIWEMGQTNLKPFQRTTDTVIVLYKKKSPAVHYAVAPVVLGRVGPNSYTLDYTQGECYIKSFLPQQLVTDAIALEVALVTNYGLQSISLEKWENNVFNEVQTISPVNRLHFTFRDASPRPGRNTYRVRLINNNQEVFYSQTEGVFFTPPQFMQLFPNPVTQGSEVNIVVAEDAETRVEVFDSLGKKVNALNESGVIKTISTANLAPGVYVVRVQTPANGLLSVRLIVM